MLLSSLYLTDFHLTTLQGFGSQDQPSIRKIFTLKNQSPQTLLTDCVLSFSEHSHDQLRMSDLEFGRLSGGLVHSRSENDAEWEGTDVLWEQREIGVMLEMEKERWLERTNRSDVLDTEPCPDSDSPHSHRSSPSTPPRPQHRLALNTASPSTPPRPQHRLTLNTASPSTPPHPQHRLALNTASPSTPPHYHGSACPPPKTRVI
ncbi:hypothetical protein BLNAU_14862 [Blattamonas nauphoetae]|uniref:Uncharacterized protein n=1 Tax=Blattamonas nauphoetae TaxID=2049346 RepID=A0ABQ9XDZ7_9EUKA|nr:hypothetical protein BLNAU_14862 [Blattamonas nauphoetae]